MTTFKSTPRIGFVGCGNMAQAFVGGLVSAGYSAENITLTDYFAEKAKAYADSQGVAFADTNGAVAGVSDIIILAVKPDTYEKVLLELAPVLNEEHIIISIAPGITVEQLGMWSGGRCRVIRTMPNTPVMVSQGCIAMVPGSRLSDAEIAMVSEILGSVGTVEIIKESLMDTFTAVSGSSPAYVFLFIEAMADAAVMGGMPRDMAYRVCSQAVLGSGMMVQKTGMHPGVLKDMVCSPGGTTIEAVRRLEDGNLRSTVWDAVEACRIKAGKMK